ncbi:hypothetical protein D3C85_1723600 [compost metagenome]
MGDVLIEVVIHLCLSEFAYGFLVLEHTLPLGRPVCRVGVVKEGFDLFSCIPSRGEANGYIDVKIFLG